MKLDLKKSVLTFSKLVKYDVKDGTLTDLDEQDDKIRKLLKRRSLKRASEKFG